VTRPDDSRRMRSAANGGGNQRAVENLRAYIGFLEEMALKYGPELAAQGRRERRARRTIEAAFSDDVESRMEGL
jgi:hypothetical protein